MSDTLDVNTAILRDTLADNPLALAALDALVAERDAIRSAAEWLIANRGHRGEAQAWKLLADALAKEDTDE